MYFMSYLQANYKSQNYYLPFQSIVYSFLAFFYKFPSIKSKRKMRKTEESMSVSLEKMCRMGLLSESLLHFYFFQ